MRVVGLISSYREGSLLIEAIRSAQRARFDHLVIAEGPAGDERCDHAPPSMFEGYTKPTLSGTWKSDADKRSAMVRHCRGFGPGPTWGVWIDGDEVLVNGEYLRDELQAVLWQDEEDGQTRGGWPMRLVERDGSVAVCRAKVVRIDLIDRYLVSSSGIRFKNHGVMFDHAEGNLPQSVEAWWAPRLPEVAKDKMYLEPPLPCEPFLVHRSALRHPARRGLRMHEQEARELDRLGLLKH